MSIQGLHHFTVRCDLWQLEALRDYYCSVLGLQVGDRPKLKFDGYWLYAGVNPVVHLYASGSAMSPENTALDHISFKASELDAVRAELHNKGIAFTEAPVPGYDRLLDELIDTVVVNLERHPRMGRPFMSRQPDSVEAQTRHERLQAKLASADRPAEMREYVMTDYLVLYAVLAPAADGAATIYLISIKHHKQLSFDFERLWRPLQPD